MHPILARRERLTLYMAAWLPLAAMLAGMMVLSAGSSWTEALTLATPLLVIYAFLCLTAWYPCRALPLRGASLVKALATHAATAAVSAALWSAAALGLARLLQRLDLFAGVENRIRDEIGLLFAAGVLLYLLAVAVHYLVVAFEGSREAEQRALRAEVAAREAELRALRAQLDPHFLFNSLNSISSLVTSDARGAREMCVQLGDFLRASLRLGSRPTVPLSEELAALELYLAVERARFGRRLVIDLQVDEAARDCPVPPLVLQPLVENALKHGISSLLEGGRVGISARRRATRLELRVDNPFDPDGATGSGTGLGLANLRQRLRSLYGAAARLETGADGGTFRVEVRLPVEDEEPHR